MKIKRNELIFTGEMLKNNKEKHMKNHEENMKQIKRI